MPVRKIALALGASLTLLFAAAPAALARDHACPPPGRVAQVERAFQRLDADGDGALGPAELGPAARIVLRIRTSAVAVIEPLALPLS